MNFHPGDIVMDKKGRELELEGRNQCRRDMWTAFPLKDGKPQKDRWAIVTEAEIVAVKRPAGFQYILA